MKKKSLLIIGIVAGVVAVILGILLLKGSSQKYLITFDSDGGTSIASQEVKEGENVIKPSNPTKENYLFEEWTYNGRTFNFNTVVESDMTLVAKWKKENPDEFNVVIDSKNDTETKTVVVLEGEKLEKPEDPVYKGYEFVGWEVNGQEYDFNAPVTRTFVLEAKWEKIKGKYTITFNSDGGTAVPSQTVIEGEKVTAPEDPTKEDATFVEWQLNGKTYDFETEVTGNITLKAKWNAIKYTGYKYDAYRLRCYLEGTTTLATSVDKGTKIECSVSYEVNSTDKVSTFKYDLKYGKGLKLVKSTDISDATVTNGNYKFTFSKAEPVGSGGKFTFEVTDAGKVSELYVSAENIKFITANGKYYSSGNSKHSMKTIWDEMKERAVTYKEDIFYFECDNLSEGVKVGDQIKCNITYELNASDAILKFQYDIKYGKGFKLVKSENLDNAVVNGNNYRHSFTSANGVGSGGKFTFEVTDISNANELYITMDNLSFLTQKSEYYKLASKTRKFGDVWADMDKYATTYKENVFGIYCYAGDSLSVPKEVGQKFQCNPLFELYTYDAITHFKFDVNTGKGVKFTGITKDDIRNEIKKDEIIGNTHRITLSTLRSLFEYSYVLNFEITDISDDNELYVSMDNIKFKTIKDEYYSNPSKKAKIS